MPLTKNKILFATDGSPDAVLAARAAVDLSTRTGSELHVVHAWHSVPSTRFEAFLRGQLQREAEEILDEQTSLIQDAGGVVAEAHINEGPAIDEILDLAEEIGANLIVLGSRGHSTVERLVLGSVSEGVVHHAHCPVLVLRGGEDAWPPERVVIGDDGSEAAKMAAELASSFGGLFEAKGLLVRAYPKLPEMDLPERQMDARMVDDELRHEERNLEELASKLEATLGSRPHVRIDIGDPAARILEAAQDGGARNTLIAVGSRGLGRMQRIRLGSVSTKILRAAEGPVLIHPPPHEAGEARV
jgi:nucleotide-binding universal stress UspA family protein